MNNDSFSTWLDGELRHRNWTRAELARRAHISRTAVSNVLNETRKPGPDLARAIAGALDIDQAVVFYQAGLPTENRKGDEQSQRVKKIERRIKNLTDDKFDQLDRFIEFLVQTKK